MRGYINILHKRVEYQMSLKKVIWIVCLIFVALTMNVQGAAYTWLFNGSTLEGWQVNNASSAVSGSYLRLNPGNDPQLISPALNMQPGSINYLKIGLRNNSTDNNGGVFWSASGWPYSGVRSASFTVPTNSQFNNVIVRLDNISNWNSPSIIDRVRIDPVANGAGGNDSVLIDFIFLRQDIHDPDPPTITAVSPSGWTNGPISVNFQSNDPSDFSGVGPDQYGSGINYFRYRVDPQPDATVFPNSSDLWSGLTLGQVTYQPGQLEVGANFFHVYCFDRVGRVSPASGEQQAWLYYDPQPPSAPAIVTAYPDSNYENLFAFDWDPSDDYGLSGVSAYYWKINSGPENYLPVGQPWVNWGALATNQGYNTFYVRAVDNVGNTSGYASVAFYLDSEAPTAPSSVTASPTTNTSNSFGFSWGAGFDATSGVAGYFWRINGGPETFTTGLSVPAESHPEVVEGFNTFYVRTEDNLGNSSSFSSVAFDLGPDCSQVHTGFLTIDSFQVNGIRKPAESLLVSTGDTFRIFGSGVDQNLDSILVYDAFSFDSTSSGLSWISVNSCGQFVYPPLAVLSITATSGGFYSLWFAAGNEATPLLAVVDAGCSSCSIDSIVAALNSDTTNAIISIATPKSDSDSLSFPILTVPTNRDNILSTENDAFLRGYFMKYRGPLGYSFLSDSLGNGWLNRGDSLVQSRDRWVKEHLPEYFRTTADSSIILATRDASGKLRIVDGKSPAGILNRINAILTPINRKYTVPALNFGTANIDKLICGGLCFLVPGGQGACKPLSFEMAVSIGPAWCNSVSNNPAACNTLLKAYKNAHTVVSWVEFLSQFDPGAGICKVATQLQNLYNATQGPGGQWLPEQGASSYNRNSGKIKSYTNLGIPKRRIVGNPESSGSVDGLIDTTEDYMDYSFTLTEPPTLRVSCYPDNAITPTSLNLTVTSDVLLYFLTTDSQAVPIIRLVNGNDTVYAGNVVMINDTQFTASLPLSGFPNYIASQTYAAIILAEGFDLFSNFGEHDAETVLGVVTIDGGTLEGPADIKFTIPPGAISGSLRVTIVPTLVSPQDSMANWTAIVASSVSAIVVGQAISMFPDGFAPTVACTLSLPIDTAFSQLQPTEHLFLARYDSVGQSWYLMPSIVDSVGMRISCPVPEFGTYGVVVTSSAVNSCCFGTRGNVNNVGNITVSDLTYLVQYLFNSGQAPVCTDEANVNGVGGISVADLTYLVQFLFNGGAQPPICP